MQVLCICRGFLRAPILNFGQTHSGSMGIALGTQNMWLGNALLVKLCFEVCMYSVGCKRHLGDQSVTIHGVHTMTIITS